MFLNIRQKPQELIYHEALSNRSILSDKEQRKLAALSSGHVGECEYDRLFDDAGHGSLLIYRDIWMKVDDALIQADSLIIADGVLAVDPAVTTAVASDGDRICPSGVRDQVGLEDAAQTGGECDDMDGGHVGSQGEIPAGGKREAWADIEDSDGGDGLASGGHDRWL